MCGDVNNNSFVTQKKMITRGVSRGFKCKQKKTKMIQNNTKEVFFAKLFKEKLAHCFATEFF